MRSRPLRTLAAIGVLILLVLAVLQSPPVRSVARTRAEGWLREHAHVSARIGTLDYSLFRFTIEARDVSLAPVDRPDAPFFAAARITASIGGVPFLAPLHLISADVDRARITLARDAQGRFNLPHAERPGGPLPTAWLVPEAATLRHLTLVLDDATTGFAIEVPDASWFARRDLRGLEGLFVVDGYVALRWPGRALSLANPHARVRWNGRSVHVEAIATTVLAGAPGQPGRRSEPARLGAPSDEHLITTFIGTADVSDVFGTATMTADGSGRAALDQATRWWGLPLDAAGGVRWTGRVAGPLSSPEVEVTLEGDGLRLQQAADVALTSTIRLADGWIRRAGCAGPRRRR